MYVCNNFYYVKNDSTVVCRRDYSDCWWSSESCGTGMNHSIETPAKQ